MKNLAKRVLAVLTKVEGAVTAPDEENMKMLLRRKRMLELMERKRMTAKWLAAKLGVSKQFFSQVLQGAKKLSFERSRILVGIFGADDLSYVIDWDGMGIRNPFTEVA